MDVSGALLTSNPAAAVAILMLFIGIAIAAVHVRRGKNKARKSGK